MFNLHTHTFYSDGSSEPAEYVKEAARQGFSVLGFSDHSPVPFENNFAIREERLDEYCRAILDLREPKGEPVPGKPEILLGLEIDYIPGLTRPISDYHDKYPFDYFIGSVHLVRNGTEKELWFIDGPDIEMYDNGLTTIFGGDAQKAVAAYWRQVCEMVGTQSPDIIGHLDKIKMYNRGRYFSEEDPWYISLVDETLALIKKHGLVVEVNTRGIYKKRSDTLFPGPAILKKILAGNIPITISSDAHKPAEIGNWIPEAGKMLYDIGFREQAVLTRSGWKNVPL